MIPIEDINKRFEYNKVIDEMQTAFNKFKKVKLTDRESELMMYLKTYGIEIGAKKYLGHE